MNIPLANDGSGVGKPQVPMTPGSHREWCKRRARENLAKTGIGTFGNAYGQLYADLMRHSETKDLLESFKLVTTREQMEQFVERL